MGASWNVELGDGRFGLCGGNWVVGKYYAWVSKIILVSLLARLGFLVDSSSVHMKNVLLFSQKMASSLNPCDTRQHPHSGRNHGGFAQGALVTGGGGGIFDCTAVALVESPPVASAGAIPLFAARDLVKFEGGTLVVGCLLAHGATVPDSAPDDGVPLRVRGASASCEPGLIIDVGPLAQGAVVPTVGVLGMGGGLFIRGATVLVPGRLVAA